jgi:hypothetical protein
MLRLPAETALLKYRIELHVGNYKQALKGVIKYYSTIRFFDCETIFLKGLFKNRST